MTIVNNSDELKRVYRPDKPCGKIMNHSNVTAYACRTLIEFDAWGKHWHSRKWLINDDNELIFNIEQNLFINLDMFNDGTGAMHNLVAYDQLRDPEPQLSLFQEMATMIKFRAWDSAQKKMLVPDSIEFVNGEPYWIDVSDGDDGYQNDSDPKHILLEQFTGIKDENGREIYEGDIVRELALPAGTVRHIALIIFYPEYARFGLKEGNGYPLWGKSEFVSYEVIGNIHENPELMEANNV